MGRPDSKKGLTLTLYLKPPYYLINGVALFRDHEAQSPVVFPACCTTPDLWCKIVAVANEFPNFN